MEEQMKYANLSAQAIWEELGAKPLNTKKGILEYIEAIRLLAKKELSIQQLQATYRFIELHIEGMGKDIKVNTLVYLKNELRNKLGKLAQAQKPEDHAFIQFYKQTFENEVKTKAYTWALADLSSMNETSILETLKTINTYCLRSKLTMKEKDEIQPMIKRLVDTQNLRLINQVRSMEGIRKAFKIKVVQEGKYYKMMTT